ncbi:MAG: hypothetical protein HY718_15925 [Planctomycetes bacterium]|nr:hypothetical protein [Planctomycetota bacterium]
MVTAQMGWGYRSGWLAATAMTAGAVLLAGTMGCGHPKETGYADQCKTQIQFYSPEGAVVTVRACPARRSHQVGTYEPFGDRLERTPEEASVFNLSPGRYEFKYVSAEGLPGASVYGELDVKNVNCEYARVFQRRSFVPISLPSTYYQHVAPRGDEIFPFRGEAMRTAIDELDLQRLRQGDVVEKVFVVADLEDAQEELEEAQVVLAVAERELQYAEARFKNAYYDFRTDVSDPGANFWGTDRAFIHWEARKQRQTQKLNDIQDKIARLTALLKGDHVLIRKGMLVVATQEVVKPYRDVESAANRIGEVLLVMRLGGRHMHWGDPRQELASYQP